MGGTKGVADSILSARGNGNGHDYQSSCIIFTKYEQVQKTRNDIRHPGLLAQLVNCLVIISPVAVDAKEHSAFRVLGLLGISGCTEALQVMKLKNGRPRTEGLRFFRIKCGLGIVGAVLADNIVAI